MRAAAVSCNSLPLRVDYCVRGCASLASRVEGVLFKNARRLAGSGLRPLDCVRTVPCAPSVVHTPRYTMARRVAIGEVALNILDASLPSEGAPILAKRKSYERKIDEAKQEERDTAALSRARKVVKEQGHQTLRVKSDAPVAIVDPVLETALRKTATRGVVSLFNAVREAQKEVRRETKTKTQKRRKSGAAEPTDAGASAVAPGARDISKESFLDILRRGTAPPKAAPAGGSAAGGTTPSYLRDDYMLGQRTSKAKHWELDVDDDLADVEDEAEGGSERDFADDED